MIRFHCDACKRQISLEQAVNSMATQGAQGVAVDITQPLELFCPDHLDEGKNWWEQTKPAVLKQIHEEAKARLENALKLHFKGNLKAVK